MGVVSEVGLEMGGLVGEIMGGSGQETGVLKGFLEGMRWRFGDILARIWKNGECYRVGEIVMLRKR